MSTENSKHLLVSYSVYRTALLNGITYYVVQPSGYFGFTVIDGQTYSCLIDQLADKSDFEAYFKPTATEVSSVSDALGSVQLNHLSESAININYLDNHNVHLPPRIVTLSGDHICSKLQGSLLEFVVNIIGPIVGAGASITYTIQEVDPGDLYTSIGSPTIVGPITTTGTVKTSIVLYNSTSIKISWIVTGTNPVFNNIYTTLFSRMGGRNLIQGERSEGQPNVNPILIGGTDGTNIRSIKLHDLDSAGSSEYNLGVSIRLPGTGGSVSGGSLTNPIRIDPVGNTLQPISASSLPLPTGAATESTLSALLSESTFISRIPTIGQKTMANSTSVVLAVDQVAIPVNVLSGGDTVSKIVYDITDTVIYIGKAPLGTLTSLPLWLIKKTTLSGGNPVSTLWSSNTAIWDNRASEVYQ